MAAVPAAWSQSTRASVDTTVARTQYGPVRGYRDRDVQVFKGVRYGADTRARRFQTAQPPVPWTEPMPALEYGPAAPQTNPQEAVSEDCLFLNVWTPAVRSAERRPVMVYLHGGEYSHGSGSSPLYDGTHLARDHDVVVVTVNHRLSALGHLFLASFDRARFADSGNVGIWDLVMALRWIRDSIAAFGGDPACVTLFGQSGGGAKIATLMSMSAARGLFHRAATMSGEQVTASGPLAATHRAEAFLAALQLKSTQLDALVGTPLERLVGASGSADPSILGSALYFGPVLDERGLTRHPFYPDAPAASLEVPMLIGTTHDETRFFFRDDFVRLETLSWEELPVRLAAEMRVDIDPGTVVETYRRLYPQASAGEVFFAATTASRSWRPAIIEAEARASAGAPVHMYQLDWRSPLDGGRWRAAHTLDIPLVFGTVAAPGALSGAGREARSMADLMSTAFVNFARSGSPQGPGMPAWPVYESDTRSTLVFDLPPRVVNDPRAEERRLFARVPFLQRGTT